ncbi:hypothetical protein DID88_001201 [Monilinia fructigena]|uniref:Uncharacterized protein n=1 Tax=Monilinia fructigena TaxID=38457 RepID=A0A395IYZ9_9HELO|nr:hypothetical protein DID88_001201 [Monilinia fructigena]
MDVFYAYTYGTAGWLALQAAPLVISPTIIITILSPEVREATPLEEYFSKSLGMTLLTLGIMVVLLTGSVPLTSSISDTTTAGVTSSENDPKAPYAVPVLTISTIYHGLIAFLLLRAIHNTRHLFICAGIPRFVNFIRDRRVVYTFWNGEWED